MMQHFVIHRPASLTAVRKLENTKHMIPFYHSFIEITQAVRRMPVQTRDLLLHICKKAVYYNYGLRMSVFGQHPEVT